MGQSTDPVPAGWKGGFAESNPAFAYPDPDLSSLPMLPNMANIRRLQRQQAVLWPEFSWLTDPGQEQSRCYQMFAPDISRIGYDDEGRVYSIICPQQGVCTAALGCLNVEVTVTGQRGWVDEPCKTLAADMTVTGQIWFSPSARQNSLVRWLWNEFVASDHPFPHDKAHAIQVSTFKPGAPDQPIFPLRKGETTDFRIPEFARHQSEAWSVGNLGVEIGPIRKTGDSVADTFNTLVMDLFNLYSGNLLLPGNILTWNVWFTEPALVNRQEWARHAEVWRKSIDADHGSPDGPGTSARYYNGSPFEPVEAAVEREIEKILQFIKNHL
ncbi:hypothetical protein [Amaricoccus solimangrovi]|uniref:Uncharacterized protein n=1 Tax=Amaricoccus solimangrovi TaxID=2589815 RepID=A0A501WYD2_9RHOB|nr:hypothetical protein [Amaricoccus solimangrovi]TPE53285.1 hypothetical protein FJM51_04505 [Amaricoccus solimangrovi]